MTTYWGSKRKESGQEFEQGTAKSTCVCPVVSGASAGRPGSWATHIWGWKSHFHNGLFSHMSDTLAGMAEGWAQLGQGARVPPAGLSNMLA